MSTIDVKTSTGDVTLIAATVDTVTLTRGAGEDPLSIARYPYTPNSLGLPLPTYKGFRIVNNDTADPLYYTVSYETNAILTPVVGAEEVYRLNPGGTDQWITDPETPSIIVVKLISDGTPAYNVEAW